MKLLLKILAGIAVLLLLLVVVAFFLPRQYHIERSLTFKAKPEVVYAQLTDLKSWKNWGAWQERDPGMKMAYSEPATGVGAWSSWESKKEGNGKMTITTQSLQKVVYNLEFPDMGMTSIGVMTLEPTNGGVRVVWSDEGDLGMNPMGRWFGLFLDKMIGPDFERGLSNLQKIVEK